MAERTRSNYRMALPLPADPGSAGAIDGVRRVRAEDREVVAALLLDAYRGTIDDEGETLAEALDAADDLLGTTDPEHSWILDGPDAATALCLVIHLEGSYYVNIIAVAAAAKQQGLGRRMVRHAVQALAEAGESEFGATITDGNTASERLFASLGARRVGPWTPMS